MISIIAQKKHEYHPFPRGLNEQYGNIQYCVLLIDLIPSISNIFSYVMQQETQVMGNFLNGV